MEPAEASEELLESLELQPSAEDEGEELSLDAAPEAAPADTDPALGAEEIEALPFEEEPGEELSFDTPPPSPPDPRDTLIRGEQETEDLRRRIGRPTLPQMTLEEIDPDEEEVEDIPMELPATPPPPPPVRSAPRPAARPAPPPPAAVATVNAAPVSVRLQNATGQTDVNIPLEVTLQNGSAQVAIHLHVTLKLKLQE